ncbi:MAG: lipoyl synthase [Deltaproteobacteria bacterium]|nr:lipoyl synthase [Deltaproteobacteria bacterium]
MLTNLQQNVRIKKPSWLKRRLPTGPDYERVKSLISKGGLHTVCQEAKCPNILECFSKHTATFMIMGSHCTRSCRFCAIDHGPTAQPDPKEPAKVAEAARKIGLNYVVITSVTRDDLPDGGAALFAGTIQKVRKQIPDAMVEVLIPDFQGNRNALKTVLKARPDVLNHNIETVPRLYSTVRPEANYNRSLELLKQALQYDQSVATKSGLMLGLGELPDEISRTLDDLVKAGCSMLTLGQYLQPSKQHLQVERFVPPEEFDNWRKIAIKTGFSQVAGGPFVRSSYHAKELF